MTQDILLSDFLRCNVRCDQGIDHGLGFTVWMHPPVHRILGWISRPSSLKLALDVWRLDQFKGIQSNIIYVKGSPAISDQATINRFPTLINANLLNYDKLKIANIVDLVFDSNSGKILYYLVSRSNPKIPGSSRWSLKIDNIKDQQPGIVITDLSSIDNLPLIRASFREEILQKSKGLRSQLEEISGKASSRLSGWLEESPWDENSNIISNSSYKSDSFLPNDWIDNLDDSGNDLDYSKNSYNSDNDEIDPWI